MPQTDRPEAGPDPDLVEQFVAAFDHHDPKLGQHYHEIYAEMVERCPVTWTDQHGGYWVLSGYAEVHHALQHHELISTHPSVSVPAFHRDRPMLPLEVDPPIHHKYRLLLAPVFSPKRIADLEDDIRATTNELIDGFIGRGRCEFMSEFADLLPVIVFTKMMGLPVEEMARFRAWRDAILHGMHEDPEIPRVATAEVESYVLALLEDRKRQRRDDILSVLIDSVADGETLTDQEILDITFLLFLAGLDTVSSALGVQFLHLAQHLEHRDQLVQGPDLIPDAIEELFRYESLIVGGRTVTRDVELYGVEMRKGDRLVVNTVAADRDPRQFPHPDEVIFDRDPNRHLVFGAGPHRCTGSHLARLEMRVVFEEVHRRTPTYRLEPGAVVRRHADNVHGIDRLPLIWDV